MRRLALGIAAASAAVLSVPLVAVGLADPATLTCVEQPDPSRWTDPAEPDEGRADPIVAVHRGAANLAPENTLDAYRYAIAYDVEMIEVDVQQTLDHRYVAFHDLDVEAKTDGTGLINTMTFEQARALNVADNDKWRGSAYDPSRMPSLEEVLELAQAEGVGVMFDLKESVTDAASVANLAADHDLLDRSVFIPYVPGRAEAILAAQPAARLILSNQLDNAPVTKEPPGSLYAASREYWAHGSDLPAFDAGDIAEAHDGCALVIPNVYQGDVTGSEAGDLAYARSIGADGAQVNNPDVAAAVLGEPVATRIAVRPAGAPVACLQDGEHGFGLPGKRLAVGDRTAVTGKAGCVALPPAEHVGRLRFAGDGSALASTALDRARG